MPDINLARQQHRRRRSARHHGLQFLAAANAAGNFVNHLLQVVAHRQFIYARPLNMPADAEQPRPAIAFRADPGILRAANAQNVGHRRNRLRVVDHRRPAIQPNHGRERRPDARNPALAFERLHQRRLFAYLISARAGVRHNFKIDAAAENVLAQEALRVRLFNRASP